LATDAGRVTTVHGDVMAILLHGCGDHGYTGSILDEIGPRCVEQSVCVTMRLSVADCYRRYAGVVDANPSCLAWDTQALRLRAVAP
jgi:hypothetical protein